MKKLEPEVKNYFNQNIIHKSIIIAALFSLILSFVLSYFRMDNYPYILGIISMIGALYLIWSIIYFILYWKDTPPKVTKSIYIALLIFALLAYSIGLVSAISLELFSFTYYLTPFFSFDAVKYGLILSIPVIIVLYRYWLGIKPFLLSIFALIISVVLLLVSLASAFGHDTRFIKYCPNYGNIYVVNESFLDSYITIRNPSSGNFDRDTAVAVGLGKQYPANEQLYTYNKISFVSYTYTSNIDNLRIEVSKEKVGKIFECLNQK